ncbi:hypothetical protein WAK64_08395 [Bacillus spongiae]|uniref:Uncharacterized protein n=1 Tax=Bacillus spongiae TaxID=2683610 RepID=A0ABU8HCM2_9BACI
MLQIKKEEEKIINTYVKCLITNNQLYGDLANFYYKQNEQRIKKSFANLMLEACLRYGDLRRHF